MFLKISFPIKPKSLTIKLPIGWINRLPKRSTLIKIYYANPTDYNKEMLLGQDNPYTSAKTYWSIINIFLNNKKIATIAPVVFEGKIISDFEKKAEL